MQYAKLIGNKLSYAPRIFINADNSILSRPTHKDYLARGYKELLPPTMPTEEPPKGKHWTTNGYEESNTTITYKWVLADNPPRTFSKMKAVLALTEMGVWQAVKSWIDANNLTDVFLAAQAFREDDPFFKKGLAALKEQLKLTDEQIESLLANCVGEG